MFLDKKKVEMQRARACISVKDMRAAGVTQGNLNSIWCGKSVRPETAGRIARALGVDVTAILADEPELPFTS